jgi:ribonuclease D
MPGARGMKLLVATRRQRRQELHHEPSPMSDLNAHIPPVLYVDHPRLMDRALAILGKHRRVALDTEADSLHHYYEKLCLIQVSTPSGNFLVDPLAGLDLTLLLDQLKGRTLVLQGADYDLRLLRKTYGFVPDRIYDTGLASQLLGYKEFSLAALVKRHFAYTLPKSSQRADWSRRPLTDQMYAYAVNDTCRLLDLMEILNLELEMKNRTSWLKQSCERALDDSRTDRAPDPKERWRIRGWTRLQGRQVALLFELWNWREKEAAKADRPTFKVFGNEALLELAVWAADNPSEEVARFRRLPRSLRGRRLEALRRAISRGRTKPESQWPPPPVRKGRRLCPDASRRNDLLRNARNALAENLEIDPGVLAPNSALLSIAVANPGTPEVLKETGALLPWQAEVVSDTFLALLRNGASPR